MGSYCLMGAEFLFGMMTNRNRQWWRLHDIVDLWRPLNFMHIKDLKGKFWVMYEKKMKWNVSCSVMSHSLQPHVLYSPWNSSGWHTGVGSCSLLQGNLPNPGIEPRFPALQADSLPSEPPGKPWVMYILLQFSFNYLFIYFIFGRAGSSLPHLGCLCTGLL